MRRRAGAGVEDMQAAGGELAAAAGIGAGREVGGEPALELERQAPAHDAGAVDGIEEGPAAGVVDVALDEADHGPAHEGE